MQGAWSTNTAEFRSGHCGLDRHLVFSKCTTLHELLLSAVRADNIVPVGNEATTNEGCLAGGACKAVVVPVSVFEGNEPRPTDSCDGFGASSASFSKEVTVAVSAVRFIVLGSESLSSQGIGAVGASEALSVPRVILVSDSSTCNDLRAFHASRGKLLFIAASAIDLLFTRNKTLRSNGSFADTTGKAFLMPLSCLVLHLLCTCSEDFSATVTPGGEGSIVTCRAIDLVCLRSELLVYEGHSALRTQETCLMPMFVFVRQVFRVDSDEGSALVASIGEDGFIAADAIGMVIA